MISGPSLFKVFLGSFFIQSSWSFEKMQGLGFAAAISPALEELYKNDEKLRKGAYKRQLVFYNAHPYMASPVLGAAIRLEEKGQNGECPREASASFKARVMGAYGAIGDSFFWGSIRPLASCIGVLASLLWGMWGPVAFLIVYNVFHLLMRWYGLKKGYSLGEGVVSYIKSLELPKWSLRFRYLASGVLGAASALLVYKFFSFSLTPFRGAWLWFGGAVIFASMAAIFLNVLLKKGMTVSRLIYLVLLPLILYGVIY